MRKIYARSCSIGTIAGGAALEFFEKNHRQGSAQKVLSPVYIGLFHEEELVGAVEFSLSRTAAKRRLFEYELIRLSFEKGVRIPGGASKLIKHFIKEQKPSSFFTYQDTTGENTKLYGHAGMTLAVDGRKVKKQYLVAPGKTLETGSRKEVLGMPYATRYGPDRILGTKLGEVYREDGTRKSNRAIFLENLGWHIEETSGDSVWVWQDPSNFTYYTYKITASDSDKYYYGVSHVKKANASVEDCLNDGYMGSGGISDKNKFKRWKLKHKSNLQKELIEIHDSRVAAYEKEATLIGDAWKNDKLCLNSRSGGEAQGARSIAYIYEIACPVHGMTLHRGKTCLKCSVNKSVSEKECATHGYTTHMGSVCTKCRAKNSFNLQECAIHGVSQFRGDTCEKCSASKRVTNKECPHHGIVKHYGDVCYKCQAENMHRMEYCAVHGTSAFRGEKCVKCLSLGLFSTQTCTIHGLTAFRNGKCVSCISDNAVTMKDCPEHGLVKHVGEKCYRCINTSAVTMKLCPIHGETKHQGNNCGRCSSMTTIKNCPKHGPSKHRGSSCYSCRGEKRKLRNTLDSEV